MKTVNLIRHAKSSWHEISLADHQRPLNHRGLRDSQSMGAIYARYIETAEYWISSATRAQQTFHGLSAHLPKGQVIITDALYTFDFQSLVEFLKTYSGTSDELTLIAHNPAIHSLISRIASYSGKFPTCAFAKLTYPVEHWRAIQQDDGNLQVLITPKSGRIL